MHELALADAVLTAALDSADRNRIDVIHRLTVRIGELQQVEHEAFEYCLKEVRPSAGPRLRDTEIAIEHSAVKFRCRACATVFGSSDAALPKEEDEAEAVHFLPELIHVFLRCPGCGSQDFEIVAGRGIEIASIEGKIRG